MAASLQFLFGRSCFIILYPCGVGAQGDPYTVIIFDPPEFSGNFQQRQLVIKQEKLDEEIAAEFCLRSISFILVGFFIMP
jgi:hypothetical protein